ERDEAATILPEALAGQRILGDAEAGRERAREARNAPSQVPAHRAMDIRDLALDPAVMAEAQGEDRPVGADVAARVGERLEPERHRGGVEDARHLGEKANGAGRRDVEVDANDGRRVGRGGILVGVAEREIIPRRDTELLADLQASLEPGREDGVGAELLRPRVDREPVLLHRDAAAVVGADDLPARLPGAVAGVRDREPMLEVALGPLIRRQDRRGRRATVELRIEVALQRY